MVTWISALERTRSRISNFLRRMLGKSSSAVTDEDLNELEEALILADVPVRMAQRIIEDLRKSYRGLNVDLRRAVAEILARRLDTTQVFRWESDAKPMVVLVTGVNGSGKTTTCAKLARCAMTAGRKVLLAAADTFRAAGAEQLVIWAERVGCDVVSGRLGADAAAVAFDALDAAIARGSDVLIIDTAGRMHTRESLMDELRKIVRALNKRMPGAPHHSWIVLDATTGQNAIAQAKSFSEVVPLSGVIVTKLDGSAKAGFVLAVYEELKLPVWFAGLGEGIEDLVPFDARRFAEALLGLSSEA